MKFFRALGKWLVKAYDLAADLLSKALTAQTPDGESGFDVFGRRVAAATIWLVGALLVSSPFLHSSLAQPMGDVLFRTGTSMWTG